VIYCPLETIEHKITKTKFFFRFFCWFHNALFHYWILIVFVASNLTSYNFLSSIILLVKILTKVLSFLSPLTIGMMYFMGINGCNQYTNWYGVYPVVTLYVILYENNTVNRCSSQFDLFSLTNLINNVPSTLLIDLAYPYLEDNKL
jgi:hypothetical protein